MRAPAVDARVFLPDGATVVVQQDRIVGVEEGRPGLPVGTEVSEHDGTCYPAWSTAIPVWSRTRP